MTDLDQWLIEELTPELSLHENATIRYERGSLIVHWFDNRYIFDIEEVVPLLLRSQRIETLVEFAYKNTPVVMDELYKNAAVVYTTNGRECYTKRGSLYCRVPENVSWRLAPLPEPEPTMFTTTITGGLLAVSANERLPHEAVAHGTDFLAEIVHDMLTLDEHTRVVIQDAPRKKVIVGHETLVQRFYDDLGRRAEVIRATDLSRWR